MTTLHEISWSRRARWIIGIGLLIYLALIAAVLERARVRVLVNVALMASAVVVLLALLRLMLTLRVMIDGADLVVGFPFWKRRVPLRAIDQVSPTHYHWARWGGWGIRWLPGATLYNVPGDQGRAVELTLRDGKRVLFSASDPEAVAAAIREQQARTSS